MGVFSLSFRSSHLCYAELTVLQGAFVCVVSTSQ